MHTRTPAARSRASDAPPTQTGVRTLRPREMAGAGGFEPPDARSKVSCLTAWPRPTNRTGFPSRTASASGFELSRIPCGKPVEPAPGTDRGDGYWPKELLGEKRRAG